MLLGYKTTNKPNSYSCPSPTTGEEQGRCEAFCKSAIHLLSRAHCRKRTGGDATWTLQVSEAFAPHWEDCIDLWVLAMQGQLWRRSHVTEWDIRSWCYWSGFSVGQLCKGQLLSDHAYILWEVKDPLSL